MKFHGVTMVGPFVCQKLTSKPDPFIQDRDQGRIIWINDGTIWYGSRDEWVNFSSGAGDASEVEDMYSDLLRTTIFLNGSYDAFELDYDENILVESTTMTHNAKEKRYEYTAGEEIISDNLFDSSLSSTVQWVDYVLPSVHYEYDIGYPTIEVSSDGGAHWFVAKNNQITRIPNEYAGQDLRMKFTGGATATEQTGELYSWGIMYNKDLNAACSKYGLTYANFEAEEDQTIFELNYVVGAIQVFLNGDLLDTSDYDATTGTEIVFPIGLQAGDIVYVISFSTSILNPNMDFSEFIRRDGSVMFTNSQPMGGNNITNMADGVADDDAATYGQVKELSLDILKAIAMGTWEGDYHAAYTSDPATDLITNIDISIPDATSPTWTANIVYNYVNDLPDTVVYSFNGKTVTQTYAFDPATDLPTGMTQVTTTP